MLFMNSPSTSCSIDSRTVSIPYSKETAKLPVCAPLSTRTFCSLLDYAKIKNEIPSHLSFSLAALIAYYKGEYNGESILLQDDEDHIDYMQKVWEGFELTAENTKTVVTNVLAYSKLWETDLNQITGLTDTVTDQLYRILKDGIKQSVKTLL